MNSDQSDIKKISLLTDGKVEEQEKKYVFNLFSTNDLEYLIKNKIRPTVVQVIMKEDEKMMKRLRVYTQRYDIPIVDYSIGEIDLKEAEVDRKMKDGEEWYSLDLTSCPVESYQLDFSELDGLLSITLPTSIEDIPDNCFFCCSSLSRIYLPKKLQSIGESCFFGCESLMNITIPKGVLEFKENTFGQCTSLSRIAFEDGNPSQIKKLGRYCYANCYSLEEINISGVEGIIPEYCFVNCVRLRRVKFPTQLTRIGVCSFKSCGIQQIELPTMIKEIGREAFAWCSNLEGVELSKEYSELEKISKRCFYKSGIQQVIIECEVGYIGDEAFAKCKNLRVMDIREPKSQGKDIAEGYEQPKKKEKPGSIVNDIKKIVNEIEKVPNTKLEMVQQKKKEEIPSYLNKPITYIEDIYLPKKKEGMVREYESRMYEMIKEKEKEDKEIQLLEKMRELVSENSMSIEDLNKKGEEINDIEKALELENQKRQEEKMRRFREQFERIKDIPIETEEEREQREMKKIEKRIEKEDEEEIAEIERMRDKTLNEFLPKFLEKHEPTIRDMIHEYVQEKKKKERKPVEPVQSIQPLQPVQNDFGIIKEENTNFFGSTKENQENIGFSFGMNQSKEIVTNPFGIVQEQQKPQEGSFTFGFTPKPDTTVQSNFGTTSNKTETTFSTQNEQPKNEEILFGLVPKTKPTDTTPFIPF